MNTLFLKLKNRNVILMLSVGFALALYLARIKITHSIYFAFLVWNLFLAAIPYLVSQLMLARSQNKKINPFLFVCGFGLWLLFLPNSPYIITDLVHLHDGGANLLWLDMFIIFVFALNGLLFGLLSLLDMAKLLRSRFAPKTNSLVLFIACMASGYGIYLGRFLRFNSWDILTRPKLLFIEIFRSLNEPKVWMITMAFGGFLWILFQLLQSLFGTDRKEVFA